MLQCMNNPSPWEHRGESIPAYSLVCTQKTLALLCNAPRQVSKNQIRQNRRMLVECSSIVCRNQTRRGTVITVANPTAWSPASAQRKGSANTKLVETVNIVGPSNKNEVLTSSAVSDETPKLLQNFQGTNSDESRTLAVEWLKAKRKDGLLPKRRNQSDEKLLQSWCSSLDDLNRIDGVSWAHIRKIITFCVTSDFRPWQIATPTSLRGRSKSDPALRKWQVIASQVNLANTRAQERTAGWRGTTSERMRLQRELEAAESRLDGLQLVHEAEGTDSASDGRVRDERAVVVRLRGELGGG